MGSRTPTYVHVSDSHLEEPPNTPAQVAVPSSSSSSSSSCRSSHATPPIPISAPSKRPSASFFATPLLPQPKPFPSHSMFLHLVLIDTSSHGRFAPYSVRQLKEHMESHLLKPSNDTHAIPYVSVLASSSTTPDGAIVTFNSHCAGARRPSWPTFETSHPSPFIRLKL